MELLVLEVMKAKLAQTVEKLYFFYVDNTAQLSEMFIFGNKRKQGTDGKDSNSVC